jgi:hypothetical protein
MLKESLDFWNTIEGKIKQLIRNEMRKVMQCERYTVTTAPNGTTIGVTLPQDTAELFIPYSQEVSTASVGDVVLVIWRGSLSNAKAWYFGNGLECTPIAPNGYATLDSDTKVTASQASSAIITVTESATLALENAGKFHNVASNNAITITIPTNSSVAFPIGTEMEFCRNGGGAVTFVGASGVTVSSIDSQKSISDIFGCAALKKLAADTWILTGSLG